ncbi:MAG: HEAT repeat domain-containing protein [Opitutales bacterium]|nr:HEAT repeat domain-containing protein [Opitutales bacterium]MCH8540615.1 HEAT repeat domain-containing protein [Opitutales bacterium]
MFSRIRRWLRLAFWLCLFPFAGGGAGMANAAAEEIGWRSQLEATLFQAGVENEPVLVFFVMEGCGWCRQMEEEFADPEVRAATEGIFMVRVDIREQSEVAGRYRIQEVPLLVLLSPEGRVLRRELGYRDRETLVSLLKALKDGSLEAEIAAEEEPEEVSFADLLIQMGEEEGRVIKAGLVNMNPFPREEFVALLEHDRLVVRLGALEILEEVSGHSLGWDPWVPTAEQSTARQRWAAWAAEEDDSARRTRYAGLSAEQLQRALTELEQGDVARRQRALRQLEEGGLAAVEALRGRLAEGDAWDERQRQWFRQAKYRILLERLEPPNHRQLAQRLSMGNQGVRLEAIRELGQLGPGAALLLQEFLNDSSALVRETAVDALVQTGSLRIRPLLTERLAEEEDLEVKVSLVRGLARFEDEESQAQVLPLVHSEEEDLAIIALQTLGRMGLPVPGEVVEKALEDSRWRVRVAALEALVELEQTSEREAVAARVLDDDAFVRFTAVQVLAELFEGRAVEDLEKAYHAFDDIKPIVVRAFGAIDRPIPTSLLEVIPEEDDEVLLAIAASLQYTRDRGLPLARRLVDHPHQDIASAALRVLANRSPNRVADQRRMARILVGGNAVLGQIILESLILDADQNQLLEEGANGPTEQAANPTMGQLLLEAFRGGGEGEWENPVQGLAEGGRYFLANGETLTVRQNAAIFLLSLGDESGWELLSETMESLGARQLERLIESLQFARSSYIPMVEAVLRHEERSRRHRWSLLRLLGDHAQESEEWFQHLLVWFGDDQYDLALGDLSGFSFRALRNNRDYREDWREFFKQLLAGQRGEKGKRGALILWGDFWTSGDKEILKSWTESGDPLMRRAAWWTIGKNNQAFLRENLEKIARDPDEKVREVLVVLGNPNRAQWIHYYSRDETDTEYYNPPHTRRSGGLDSEMEEILRQFTQRGNSAHLRASALLALWENGQTINPEELHRALEDLDEPRNLARRAANELLENYTDLEEEYAALVPWLEYGWTRGNVTTAMVREHFALESEELVEFEEDEEIIQLLVHHERVSNGENEEATAMDAHLVEEVSEEAEDGSVLKVIYFTQEGCPDCLEAREILATMEDVFPEMKIKTLESHLVPSRQHRRQLFRHFGVPEEERAEAPVIFAEGGYLVQDAITFESVANLLEDSMALGEDPGWWHVSESHSQDDPDGGHASTTEETAADPIGGEPESESLSNGRGWLGGLVLAGMILLGLGLVWRRRKVLA